LSIHFVKSRRKDNLKLWKYALSPLLKLRLRGTFLTTTCYLPSLLRFLSELTNADPSWNIQSRNNCLVSAILWTDVTKKSTKQKTHIGIPLTS
jgi:hypothetical protein